MPWDLAVWLGYTLLGTRWEMGPSEGWARVALVTGPDWTHAPSVADALRTAGLVFRKYSVDQLEAACTFAQILIVPPLGDAPEANTLLARHVEEGGSLICLGDTCGLNAYLGVRPPDEAREFGEGYLAPIGEHFVLGGETTPIHSVGGQCVVADGATPLAQILDRHGKPTGLCGLSVREHDSSTAIYLAPDLGLTAVRLRQGSYVEMDGLPAPDGTAPIRDGILRSEDGFMLDWDFDRTSDLAGEPPAFLLPAVDRLVGLLVRAAAYAAERMGLPLLLLWPHRNGAVATGMVSFATDGTDVQNVQTILHQATLVGLRATWCLRSPGFSLDVAKALRTREHEVALQFETNEPEDWAADRLSFQQTRLSRSTGARQLLSTSIQDGRWQGRNEFWDWCARAAIEAEIGRMPRQPGNAGCLFGTFRPFRPARRDGSLLPVLSIPCLASDIGVAVSSARALEILEHAASTHGVAHFFFETRSFDDKTVSEAFRNLVAHARQRGVEWATAEEIVERMKALRTMRVELGVADEGLAVALHPEYDMEEAAVCITGETVVGASAMQKRLRVSRVVRYGIPCCSVTVDLSAQCPTYIALERTTPAEMAS